MKTSVRRYDTIVLGLLKKEEEELEEECQIGLFTSRGAYITLCYIAILYIHILDGKSAVEHDGGV